MCVIELLFSYCFVIKQLIINKLEKRLYLRACYPEEVVHSDVSPENKGADIMADGSVELFDKTELYIIRMNETESMLVVKLAMASGG